MKHFENLFIYFYIVHWHVCIYIYIHVYIYIYWVLDTCTSFVGYDGPFEFIGAFCVGATSSCLLVTGLLGVTIPIWTLLWASVSLCCVHGVEQHGTVGYFPQFPSWKMIMLQPLDILYIPESSPRPTEEWNLCHQHCPLYTFRCEGRSTHEIRRKKNSSYHLGVRVF